jgi:hypothetical protein
MKRFLLAIVIGLPAMCATNSVTIAELTGSGQAGRPFTISRVFAPGEIASFPKPQIGGAELAAWQADVLNRWPDGTVKHALISFRQDLSAGGSVLVRFVNSANACHLGDLATCQAAALTQAQMLAFDPGTGPGTWGAEIGATQAAVKQTANARTILAAGSWRYWLRGPVVTQAILEDRGGARAYDFGWQCATNCTGAYTAVTWTQATPGSQYQSLHPIFVGTFYAGWAGVQLDYILEDPWTDRIQDQAYDLTLKAHADLSVTKYTRAALWHGAGSRWRRRYWDGATPGRVQVDLNFPYMMQSRAVLQWDLSKVVGCCGPRSAVGLEIAEFQSAMTDSSKFYTELPENLLDPRTTGTYTGDMGSTGGRAELGPLPRWDVRWLYTMNEGLYRVMVGEATSLGWIPYHLREPRTDNYYLSSALEPTPTTKATGHFLSIDARPTGESYNFFSGSAADRVVAVGTVRGANNTHSATWLANVLTTPDASTAAWYPDVAHIAATAYTAYVATGDWYFLEEQYALAGYGIYDGHPGTDHASRDNSAGYLNEYEHNLRGGTWNLRNLGHAAFIAPDAEKESSYFGEKVAGNIAVREGKYGATGGAYYNNAAWQFGNTQMGATYAHDRYGVTATPNPLNIPYFQIYNDVNGDTSGGRYVAGAVDQEISMWQVGYELMAIGWLETLGFLDANIVAAAESKLIINTAQAPGTPGFAYNPWLSACYVCGALDGNHAWAQTAQQLWDMWGPGWHDMATWPAETFPGDMEHGYNWIAQAEAAVAGPYRDGPLLGKGSYTWLVKANTPWAAGLGSNVADCGSAGSVVANCDNPKWALAAMDPLKAIMHPRPTRKLTGTKATGARLGQ